MIIENQAYIGFLLITMKKLFLKKKSHFTKKGLSLNTHLVLIGVSFSLVAKDVMDFAKKSATILLATSLPRDSLWKNSHEKTNYRETSSESPLPDKNSNTQIQTQIQVQIKIQVQGVPGDYKESPLLDSGRVGVQLLVKEFISIITIVFVITIILIISNYHHHHHHSNHHCLHHHHSNDNCCQIISKSYLSQGCQGDLTVIGNTLVNPKNYQIVSIF